MRASLIAQGALDAGQQCTGVGIVTIRDAGVVVTLDLEVRAVPVRVAQSNVVQQGAYALNSGRGFIVCDLDSSRGVSLREGLAAYSAVYDRRGGAS